MQRAPFLGSDCFTSCVRQLKVITMYHLSMIHYQHSDAEIYTFPKGEFL